MRVTFNAHCHCCCGGRAYLRNNKMVFGTNGTISWVFATDSLQFTAQTRSIYPMHPHKYHYVRAYIALCVQRRIHLKFERGVQARAVCVCTKCYKLSTCQSVVFQLKFFYHMASCHMEKAMIYSAFAAAYDDVKKGLTEGTKRATQSAMCVFVYLQRRGNLFIPANRMGVEASEKSNPE